MRAFVPAVLLLPLLLLPALPSRTARACVKPILLETPDESERTTLLALDSDCREGLRLLAAGRAGVALPLLQRAAGQARLLSRDLSLPLAEAMYAAGSPVEATLFSWEAITRPEKLVEARRFELVERLPHGRASRLLRAEPDRPARVLLKARAARDKAEPKRTRRKTDPHRLGVLLPLSGRLAAVGQRLLRGMRLALDGQTVLVVRDTAGEATTARQLIGELAGEGVIGVVGPVERVVGAAAVEVAKDLKVPLIRLSVEDDTGLGGRWALRAFVSRRNELRALVARCQQDGMTRFAVLHARSGRSVALAELFGQQVRALGAKLVARQGYADGTKTLQKAAKALRAKRFDAVFVADKPGAAALVLRFLAREDIWTRGTRKKVTSAGDVRYVQILGPAGWRRAGVAANDGRYLRGALVASEWPGLSNRAARALSDRAKAEFGHAGGVLEAIGHDAVLVVQAAAASGRRQLADKLRAPPGAKGVLGLLRFAEDGEPIRTPGVYRVEKGSFVLQKSKR